MWTDDPIADFNRHDAEQQKHLNRLPVCYGCGEPIQQDDAVCIEGFWFCDDCLDDMRERIERW
jgi:formylmethanofuran dehydrogenase subunit E